MNERIVQIAFQTILVLTLFAYWAGFALLVVNKLFYKDLPGYVIGRLCIWELVALIVTIGISQIMVKKWGNIEIEEINDVKTLKINSNYGLYFLGFFVVAVGTGIWQFWIFSQRF